MNIYYPELGENNNSISINLKEIIQKRGLLVRSTNWLGDALMTLPGVYALKQCLPISASLIVLTPEKLAALWSSVPWVDTIISFAQKRLDENSRQRIIELQPEACVVLPNSFGAAWDLWRADLPHLIGRTGRGRGALLHHRLPVWKRHPGQDRYHEARKYLEIAGACGSSYWDVRVPPLRPALPTDGQIPAYDRKLSQQPLLVLAPGAAYGPAKQWPSQYFHALARWWSNTHGMVIAIGVKEESELADHVLADCPNAINLAGKTSLPHLMQVLNHARLVVSNDSGTMHLAAALGKTGIAIFGSTDPIATGPLGGKWTVMKMPLPCSPCLRRTCHRTDHPYECLTAITPEKVIEKAEELLADGV